MKTVFVGLSGGVDSALSAYLLKQAGHKVVGVFLKAWEPDFLPCTAGEDRLDAMRVAAHLQIPFLTYDLEEEYKKSVIDYIIHEYKSGRTPNPDVVCNREIKFGAFWERAQKDGADALATGHYAQNVIKDGSHSLLRGVDGGKDQSYFLWTLRQNDLKHTIFPVGELPKSEVRRLAEKIKLPNATKRDSQGLCFLGHVDMQEFLKHYIPAKKGVVRSMEGKAIGEHDGVWFYTLNQRLPLQTGTKVYVVSKDVQKNELVVSEKFEEDKKEIGGSTEYLLTDTNWIREIPQKDVQYEAQIRYHGTKHSVRVDGSKIIFEKPVLAALGQSLVLYSSTSSECIGGGIIESNEDH